MDPYRSVFEAAVGRPIHYLEVYPASEGFVAIQVRAADPGLTLMLDYGIFYEFVPVAELRSPAPRRLTIAEVRVGEPYAVLLTDDAGRALELRASGTPSASSPSTRPSWSSPGGPATSSTRSGRT